MQLNVKLPRVSLLLVESNEDAKDKHAGVLMEAAGEWKGKKGQAVSAPPLFR